MAAPGARRPLLLLLLGEPWEGGRAGRGRRLGTNGKGRQTGWERGARAAGVEQASSLLPARQWCLRSRSPGGPQDSGARWEPSLRPLRLSSSRWAVLLAPGLPCEPCLRCPSFLTAGPQQREGFSCSARICRTRERWLARVHLGHLGTGTPGHTCSRIPEHLLRPVRPPKFCDFVEFGSPPFFFLRCEMNSSSQKRGALTPAVSNLAKGLVTLHSSGAVTRIGIAETSSVVSQWLHEKSSQGLGM